VQTFTEALGAINTPSLNFADTVRVISANNLNSNIDVVAHIQGGSIANGGLALLTDKIKFTINAKSYGAQLAFSNPKLNSIYNERGVNDPIPFIDPRNWLNNLNGNITTYSDGKDGHGFIKNYGVEAILRGEAAEQQQNGNHDN